MQTGNAERLLCLYAGFSWTRISIVSFIAVVSAFIAVWTVFNCSCFAYLERRYNQQVRQIASFLFFVYVVLMSPLLAYTPSLAFSQVSGINLHYITPILVFVCVFYTTFGGLRWEACKKFNLCKVMQSWKYSFASRAVVWTDTLQFSMMILAVAIVMILGTSEVGGIKNVFTIAEEGNRLIWFK